MSQIRDSSEELKYSKLSHLAKCFLMLSHSIGVLERGFSVHNALLNKELIALGKQTVKAPLLMKVVIRVYGSVVNAPINKEC